MPYGYIDETALTYDPALPLEAVRGGHVCLIIVDDMGIEVPACYGIGASPPPTPTITALAAAGVKFTTCYSLPVCTPTRAAITTGKYTGRLGLGTGLPVASDFPQGSAKSCALYDLPAAETTLADVLEANGIATAAFGKWHQNDYCGNNGGRDTVRVRGGFRYAVCHTGNMAPRAPSDAIGPTDSHFFQWPRVKNGVLDHGGTPAPGQLDKTIDPPNSYCGRYSISQNVDDVLAWPDLGLASWFIQFAFHTPHAPLQVPPAALHPTTHIDWPVGHIDYNPGVTSPPEGTFHGDLDQQYPGYDAKQYHNAIIEAMDTEIARLRAGLPADTTFILVSDNGTQGGYGIVDAPFDDEHAKDSLYEGGVRVPLIVSGPIVASPNRTSSEFVHVVDLFATVLDVFGVELPAGAHFDSLSFYDHIATTVGVQRRDTLFSQIFDPNYDTSLLTHATKVQEQFAIRDAQYKLIERRLEEGSRPSWTTSFLFFDLLADPYENTNLTPNGLASYAGLTTPQKTAFDSLRIKLRNLLNRFPGGASEPKSGATPTYQPIVCQTDSAALITTNTCTINGRVDAGGQPNTVAWVEVLDDTQTTIVSVSATQAVGSGVGYVNLAFPITGLSPLQDYYARVVATSLVGSGFDASPLPFTTLAAGGAGPTANMVTPRYGNDYAAIGVSVISANSPVTVELQYRAGMAGPWLAANPAAMRQGAHSIAQTYWAQVWTNPGSVYQAQAVVTNDQGTTTAALVQWTSAPAGIEATLNTQDFGGIYKLLPARVDFGDASSPRCSIDDEPIIRSNSERSLGATTGGTIFAQDLKVYGFSNIHGFAPGTIEVYWEAPYPKVYVQPSGSWLAWAVSKMRSGDKVVVSGLVGTAFSDAGIHDCSIGGYFGGSAPASRDAYWKVGANYVPVRNIAIVGEGSINRAYDAPPWTAGEPAAVISFANKFGGCDNIVISNMVCLSRDSGGGGYQVVVPSQQIVGHVEYLDCVDRAIKEGTSSQGGHGTKGHKRASGQWSRSLRRHYCSYGKERLSYDDCPGAAPTGPNDVVTDDVRPIKGLTPGYSERSQHQVVARASPAAVDPSFCTPGVARIYERGIRVETHAVQNQFGYSHDANFLLTYYGHHGEIVIDCDALPESVGIIFAPNIPKGQCLFLAPNGRWYAFNRVTFRNVKASINKVFDRCLGLSSVYWIRIEAFDWSVCSKTSIELYKEEPGFNGYYIGQRVGDNGFLEIVVPAPVSGNAGWNPAQTKISWRSGLIVDVTATDDVADTITWPGCDLPAGHPVRLETVPVVHSITAALDAGTDTITVAGGAKWQSMVNAHPVKVAAGGGGSLSGTGLSAAAQYYAKNVNIGAGTLQLSTLPDLSTTVNITGAGTLPLNLLWTGKLPGGTTAGVTYYVKNPNPATGTMQLAPDAALVGTVNLTSKAVLAIGIDAERIYSNAEVDLTNPGIDATVGDGFANP